VDKPSEQDFQSTDAADDTVELELPPEAALALLRAGQENEPVVSQDASNSRPTHLRALRAPSRLGRAVRLVKASGAPIVGVVAFTTAIVLLVTAYRATDFQALTGFNDAPPVNHHRSLPLDRHGQPVRFTNPFDASEVFEFPPGTSSTYAHDAVAELLLQRARERLSATKRIKAADVNRVAAIPYQTADRAE
jgi:hypothetical protein